MSGIQKLIDSESERQKAMQEIERLWDAKAGTPPADRLKLLVTLVELYEKEKFAIPPADPVTAIRFRMEQAGLTRKDLEPILGGRNRVSEILNGVRELSKAMIVKLHSTLGIPFEALHSTSERRSSAAAPRERRGGGSARLAAPSRGSRAARSRRTLR